MSFVSTPAFTGVEFEAFSASSMAVLRNSINEFLTPAFRQHIPAEKLMVGLPW
jgi:hypothetical protein